MRKALVLTLLLLVSAAAGITYAYAHVNAARDRVVLTEKTVCGNRSAADGLAVNIRTHYGHRLFWETSCALGAEPRSSTAYTFYQTRQDQKAPVKYEGVNLRYNPGPGGTSGLNFGTGAGLTGLTAAYYGLFQTTAPGEERTKAVYLKDYCDYYPIEGVIGIPGYTLYWNSDYTIDSFRPQSSGDMSAVRYFSEFFRIPVLETEQVELSVSKTADGKLNSFGIGGTKSDSFPMRTLSALTDSACYFMFDCHTAEGCTVDTSLIPGGYGIYRLPYGTNANGKSQIALNELSMVYPLDPAAELLELGVNPGKTKLLLYTREKDKYILTVIDIATMAALQRLEILNQPGDGWNWYVYDGGDFLTAIVSATRLAVVAVTDAGLYELRFTAIIPEAVSTVYYMNGRTSMAYDGRRLAVSGLLINETGQFETCGFNLAVYDETGLLYCGEYASSLDTGGETDRYSDRCVPDDYTPLAISWPKY